MIGWLYLTSRQLQQLPSEVPCKTVVKKILSVHRTLSNMAGCSFYLERKIARNVHLYYLIRSSLGFG